MLKKYKIIDIDRSKQNEFKQNKQTLINLVSIETKDKMDVSYQNVTDFLSN